MPPLAKVPKELENEFSMQGKIPIRDRYFDDSKSHELHYTQKMINSNIERVKRRETRYYGDTDKYLWTALEKFPIKNQHVAIFGSRVPFYEAVSLTFGARKCTVFEYTPIKSDDPRIVQKTYQDQERNPEQFDAGLSISSFEHDGLGRYGDPIDPDGDLKAMAVTKTLLKKGGLLYLAIPIGKDTVVWNAHRVYGDIRLPLLFRDWELVDRVGFSEEWMQIDRGVAAGPQPIFVLRNS